MVGFARICVRCASRDPKLLDYDYLRDFIMGRATLSGGGKLSTYFSAGDVRGERIYVSIGLDDMDSPFGMCTTYAGALIAARLYEEGVEFMDYPLLVRLNPNIPTKTRGNAAVCIRIATERSYLNRLTKIVLDVLDGLPHAFFPKTSPALVIYASDRYIVERAIHRIYVEALRSVVPLSRAERAARSVKMGRIEVYTLGGRARGIIGAVASIGSVFDDYTYELIAYRSANKLGSRRVIDATSVVRMDRVLKPYVFDNVDGDRVLIHPRGPDPVLFGIRGETPEHVLKAYSMISHEKAHIWCIFRTNQATGSHIIRVSMPEEAHPYETIMLDVEVAEIMYRGRTLVLVCRKKDWDILINVYRMQRGLREIVSKLRRGDTIRAVMAVIHREKRVLRCNLEEIIPLALTPMVIERNPPCPICSARMKKKSRNELYCRKCGARHKGVFKIRLILPRTDIGIRRRYTAPSRAHRHLTLPGGRMFFRYQKISGSITPKIVEPFLGREKPDPSRIRAWRLIAPPAVC